MTMLQTMKKWFTLIELLVVITIIGILATGAVSVYTSQIAKARDTTRISDVKVIETAVVQASSDLGFFPEADTVASAWDDSFATATAPYLNETPNDPRTWQICNGSACDYIYNTNTSGVAGSTYEVSTAFESTANVTSKAIQAADWGWDDKRMEFGDKTLDTELDAISPGGNCPLNTNTWNGLIIKGSC